MQKKNINYFNLMICICMIGIVFDHFNALYLQYNVKFHFLNRISLYGNLGWGGVGTAIFFMISGAVLFYNYEDKSIDLKQFYFNRFIKMCPILYITHLIFFCIASIIKDNLMYSITIKSIFNLIIGKALVGEWFTTVILFCYMIFPILKFLYKRYKILTTIILFTIFIVNQELLLFVCGNKWASYTNGIFEFWLGIILVNCHRKLKKKYIPVFILILIFMPYISLNSIFDLNGTWFYIPTIITSILIFILISYTNVNNVFVNNVSKYSYCIYLIHHQIMYMIFPLFIVHIKTQLQCFLSFVLLSILIYLLSEKFYNINIKLIKLIKSLIGKNEKIIQNNES